jgi:hypothetical protein
MLWWFMAKRVSGPSSECRIPRAYGPYPSKEMCRLAARAMMPHDRQFWPDEERLAVEQREREEAEAYKARLEARRIEAVANGERQFAIGRTTIVLNENGDEVGWGYTFGGGYSIEFEAVSGCVEVSPA